MNKENKKPVNQQLFPERLELTAFLPDTVKLNKNYDGFFFFKSPFDSISEQMFDNQYNRRVLLFLGAEPFYKGDEDLYVDSLSAYRYGAGDNRKIPFLNISFKDTGTFYIEGRLEDSYIIEGDGVEDFGTEVTIYSEFIAEIVVEE